MTKDDLTICPVCNSKCDCYEEDRLEGEIRAVCTKCGICIKNRHFKACKICGIPYAHINVNKETGEECCVCADCGYIRLLILCDKEIQKKHSETLKILNKDGNFVVYRLYEFQGAGGYSIKFKNGFLIRAPLFEKPSEESIEKFIKFKDETGSVGYISILDKETGQVSILYGDDDFLEIKRDCAH